MIPPFADALLEITRGLSPSVPELVRSPKTLESTLSCCAMLRGVNLLIKNLHIVSSSERRLNC